MCFRFSIVTIQHKTILSFSIGTYSNLTTIDSLDFTWNDGTNNVTQKLKGLALAPFKSYTYTASQKYTADKLNNNIIYNCLNCIDSTKG